MPQAQTPPAAKANFGEATYFGAPVATVVATASVSVDADQDDRTTELVVEWAELVWEPVSD